MTGFAAPVIVCLGTAPAVDGAVGPLSVSCPDGLSAYLVPSYVLTSDPSTSTDPSLPDQGQLAEVFGFGFATVLVFWVIGLKLSVVVRPFWTKT